MSSRKHFLAFLVCLVALTAWRLWPAFAQPGMALGAYGDAAGTTGWIWEVGQQFKQQGWSVFLDGDLLRPVLFGAGQMDPIPIVNPAWRLLYIFVTQLGLAPDNNYDIVIAIQFLLAGIVGWFFAAAFGVRAFWRYIFVFLMLSVQNTALRIAGHNGLVFIYGPMLALIASLKYARTPSLSSACGVAFALWLSFLSNEYFGYFSFWACLTLIVAHEWTQLKEKPTAFLFTQIKNFWPAAIGIVILLCLSHPSVSLFKLIVLFESLNSSAAVVSSKIPMVRETNPAFEFLLYGLKNPLVLFDSWFIPLPENIAQKIYGRNTFEFTFRWGLVLPIFVWWVWRLEKRDSEKIPYKTLLMAICVVTVLLGMRTDIGLSLGWLTRIFAPMFRVGVRAQFISLICMILLFTLCAQWLWDQRDKRGGKIKITLLLALVVTLSSFDLARSGPVVGHHDVFPISPRTPLAAELAKQPSGMTLMIPAADSHHESESYYLSTVHGMPVLNSNLGRLRPGTAQAFFITADTPSQASKTRLEACGVRYLIVGDLNSPVAQWSQVAGVRLIAQNSDGAIYELPHARAWPVDLKNINRSNRARVVEESHQFLSACTASLELLSVGEGAKK